MTHGRGFDESTRLLFLLSRAICAKVSRSMFEFAGLTKPAGDGHRELRATRIKRAMADMQKLLEVLVEGGTFSKTTEALVRLSMG